MLVREDPGILELSPAFIMQRLVDLKVYKHSALLSLNRDLSASSAGVTETGPVYYERLLHLHLTRLSTLPMPLHTICLITQPSGIIIYINRVE